MIHASGMMMGSLVFGLIKDSVVITRVKREKKEIETKRNQVVEMLKTRKSTMFGTFAQQDTERPALTTKE
jgi:hypothetical protein